MKIAFISGVNYPEFVEEGDIAFTLCDWTTDEEYVKYYQGCELYKITDNMAAENGISSPIDEVLKACRLLKTNEVWASDKLYDKDETLKLTKEFISKLTEEDKRNFKIVGLPQGKTLEEWLDCYKQMVAMPEINVIALSKYSVPEVFGRMAGTTAISIARMTAVKYLHDNNLVTKPLHLAGADNFIIHEAKFMKDYPLVRSIDSNIAFKLGVMGFKIDEIVAEPTERLNHQIENLTEEQISLVKHNMTLILEALK